MQDNTNRQTIQPSASKPGLCLRAGPGYYDPTTLYGLTNAARDTYREGKDCPILPVLCHDKRYGFALMLNCLTKEKHHVSMTRLDMYTPGFVENQQTFEIEANTGPNRNYGIELSGKTRHFKWFRQTVIFNQKIKLPLDRVCAGTLKLNIRMIVDGYNDLLDCPIVNETFAGKGRFFTL